MKKQLSCLLAVTMVTSMSTAAFASSATGKQTIVGDNEVNNAIYNYQIPASIDFAVDPFEKGGATQVFSGTFPIINKSDVPLSVKVSALARPKSDVTLKETSADVKQAAGYTGKEIYLEAVAAKTATVKEVTAAGTANGFESPTVTTRTPTNDAVTFTDGDGTNNANLAVDLAGVVATSRDGAGTHQAAFTLVIKDASGNEVYAIDSGTATGSADALTADEIAASFASKVLTLKVGDKSVDLTATVTTSAVSFAAADATATGITLAGLKAEIIPQRGQGQVVELDTDAPNDPTYPLFNDTAAEIKDGANTKGKVKIGAAEKDKLWFVLDSATYDKNFSDGEKTLLKTVGQKNTAGFRLMGTANPGAPWADKDLTVSVVFDVGGVSPSVIKNDPSTDTTMTKLTAIADAQGVYEQTAEVGTLPTLNLATVYGTGYTATYDIPVALGTQMSKISKVEFRPAGTLKSAATWTAWASPANYSYDAATGTIKLAVTAQKLMKDPTSTTTAQGGIAATFKADTMEATNQIKITFASDETGVESQVVTVEVPLA